MFTFILHDNVSGDAIHPNYLEYILIFTLFSSKSNSVTLIVHVRIITNMYGLPNPLSLLEGDLWPKETWKQLCQVKVWAYHENILRIKAVSNYKLNFLNIQATGLNGYSHPALHNIVTTQDVTMARPHLKMLCGDYQCLANIARDRDSDPNVFFAHPLQLLQRLSPTYSCNAQQPRIPEAEFGLSF